MKPIIEKMYKLHKQLKILRKMVEQRQNKINFTKDTCNHERILLIVQAEAVNRRNYLKFIFEKFLAFRLEMPCFRVYPGFTFRKFITK